MAKEGTRALSCRNYRADPSGVPILGGSIISDVLIVNIAVATWTAVTLQDVTKMACKSIVAKMRDGTDWKLSHLAAGTRYATIAGNLTLDMAKGRGEVLFYAQSSEATGVLEVILLD